MVGKREVGGLRGGKEGGYCISVSSVSAVLGGEVDKDS